MQLNSKPQLSRGNLEEPALGHSQRLYYHGSANKLDPAHIYDLDWPCRQMYFGQTDISHPSERDARGSP